MARRRKFRRGQVITLEALGGERIEAKVMRMGKPGYWEYCVKVRVRTRAGRWSKRADWWPLFQVVSRRKGCWSPAAKRS